MPKIGKPKSKRTPVRLRNKIQKASSAKARKDKKLAKKDPTWRSKLKKDPGIPNLFPYKDRLIHEAEESKRRKEEEILARRETEKARRNGVTVDEAMDEADEDELLDYAEYDEDGGAMDDVESTNPMAALLASARARATEFDNEGLPDENSMDEEDEGESGVEEEAVTKRQNRDASRHAHDKAFKEVISASDVVLYVLDARDPMGTRSRATEQEITSSPDRRIILVLNKIDLVPPHVLEGWLTYLRRSYPTLPLRASSGSAPNSKTFDHKNLTMAKTSDVLLKALKNWAGARQLKRAVSVGIIGYPNVGKSSVINALTSRLGARKQACPVGAVAGVTTAMREVKLDSRIKLLDSPGIVLASGETDGAAKDQRKKRRQDEQARLILLNAIPPREVVDPTPAVALLLSRLSATPALYSALLELYGIPGGALRDETADRVSEFLVGVARARGRLGRGGVPNLHAAAQTVVGDWREGRIQGWVEAPQLEDQVQAGVHAANKLGESENRRIVSEWAAEFKLDGLLGDEDSPSSGEGAAVGDVAMQSTTS